MWEHYCPKCQKVIDNAELREDQFEGDYEWFCPMHNIQVVERLVQ